MSPAHGAPSSSTLPAPEPPSYTTLLHGVAQAQSWGPAVGRRAGSAIGEGSELLALLLVTTHPALNSLADT